MQTGMATRQITWSALVNVINGDININININKTDLHCAPRRARALRVIVRREKTVSPEVVLEHLVQGDKVLHTSVMLNRSAVALLVAQTSRSSSSESLSITLLLMMCVGSVVMPATS